MLKRITVTVEQAHEGEGVKSVEVDAKTALADNAAETAAFEKLLNCVRGK